MTKLIIIVIATLVIMSAVVNCSEKKGADLASKIDVRQMQVDLIVNGGK